MCEDQYNGNYVSRMWCPTVRVLHHHQGSAAIESGLDRYSHGIRLDLCLPCLGSSSSGCLVGSICKARDVDRRDRAKKVLWMYSGTQASSKACGLVVVGLKCRCVLLHFSCPTMSQLILLPKTSRAIMMKLHLSRGFPLLPSPS
jgi:hypothetical protein